MLLINYEPCYNELVNEALINGDWLQQLNSKTLTQIHLLIFIIVGSECGIGHGGIE